MDATFLGAFAPHAAAMAGRFSAYLSHGPGDESVFQEPQGLSMVLSHVDQQQIARLLCVL